ncbi:DUF502 domain-containing protein [Aminomonas paucivorans]|uniref:DUF502 domain-containing protein n=1 Tax=Aminomonas paucivorans DSM 12260 TaxID=584708 RepID=E3CX55_9BACT|nr:DUF502 domain-containing protein [Aminomonas paucivorans]EFQ24402.1 protein of unknown function DUF502 [Aminomonas paucivorans DSM 12260]
MSPQTEQTLHRGRRWISEGTRTFAAGLLVFLPLIVLVVVLRFLFEAVQSLAALVFGLTRSVPGAVGVFLVTLALIFYAGHKLRRREKWLLDRVERFLAALPLLGSWYQTLKDLVEVLAGPGQKDRYLGVVKVPFGSGHVLGFVTRREVLEGRTTLTVFVPTSPNPTSGIVLFFPEEAVLPTDLSPESAFARIISLGLKA